MTGFEDGCNDCVVSFVDGCQGAGQPVNNNVTSQGNTVRPSVVDTTVCLIPIGDDCIVIGNGVHIMIQDAPLPHIDGLSAQSTTPFDGMLTELLSDTAKLECFVLDGEIGRKSVYVALVSQLSGSEIPAL